MSACRLRGGAGVALAAVLLASCASQTELGGGGSMVSGSGGPAGSAGASSQLAHCDRPLGTAALADPDSSSMGWLSGYGLQSPVPVLRLMMAQSNCFRVVDRGAALHSMQNEDDLARSGMLRQGSTTARGRMVTTQYLLTPNVVFSNQDAGGGSVLAGLGGMLGSAGALAGAALGSVKFQEAQTVLFLTDAQSGEQTAVAEGSAKVTDFGGLGGLGGIVGGVGGLAGISGYGNTAEGKLVVAALMDAHNKLVTQVRAAQPNLPTVEQGATASRGNAEMVKEIQAELKERGYYTGPVNGVFGRTTNEAIRGYQADNNLAVDGQPSPDLLAHITGS